MRVLWLMLAFGVVLGAEDESQDYDRDLAPIMWDGGLAILNDSGKKAWSGLATRAQIFADKIFVCVPKLKEGMPATLFQVSSNYTPTVLEPFPSIEAQIPGRCSSLQSVVDIFLDSKNILWALDVGAVLPVNHQTRRCPPKIVGFNAVTGKIVKTIDLSGLVLPESRLQFIVAEYSPEGKLFLYVSDAGTGAIIVLNMHLKKGLRVVLPDNVIDSRSPKDVMYLCLIRRPDKNDLLFFTYRSDSHLFCIETKYLQKDASAAKTWDVGKKPELMILLGSDDWDSMYFRKIKSADIYKWNASSPFWEKNFQLVHKNMGDLVPTHALPDYPNGVMRCIESNLPEYLAEGAKPDLAKNSLTVMSVPMEQGPR